LISFSAQHGSRPSSEELGISAIRLGTMISVPHLMDTEYCFI
jgi:hypothetical protein